MDVGDSGRMSVFRDPMGTFISAWQPRAMGGFAGVGDNRFGWAELNARGVENALPFYRAVFGWSVKSSEMGEGMPPYREFQLDGESVAGALEMPGMVPAEVPNHWLVYFSAGSVDATHSRAVELGAKELLAPTDYPGGRFSVVADPQGAAFGLLSLTG
jgi:predicted enzyme related to lactoylglutathione lyase